MYPNAEPTFALQVANQRNAEDRARAAQWRLARDARRAARDSRRAAQASGRPIDAPALSSRVPGWRWLWGVLRSPRPAG